MRYFNEELTVKKKLRNMKIQRVQKRRSSEAAAGARHSASLWLMIGKRTNKRKRNIEKHGASEEARPEDISRRNLHTSTEGMRRKLNMLRLK